MFTVGRFADLSGVSAKRLRHYDEIGLFRPAWVDPSNDYRYYVAGQLPELRRIAALRDLGVALPRIQRIVAGGRSLAEELRRRREALVEEQHRLDQRLAALDIRLEGAEGLDVVIRTRPGGRWASLRTVVGPGDDLGPLFVEAEEPVRDQGVRAALPPVAVNHGPSGRGLDIELLIPVDGRFRTTGRVEAARTDEVRVATTVHTGDYPRVALAADPLLEWAEATRHAVTGPPWVVYLRFSAEESLDLPEAFLTRRRAEFVTEVQLPVR